MVEMSYLLAVPKSTLCLLLGGWSVVLFHPCNRVGWGKPIPKQEDLEDTLEHTHLGLEWGERGPLLPGPASH